jgi:FtsP/CotA-like multicopper oxidase with cupredoxin domain
MRSLGIAAHARRSLWFVFLPLLSLSSPLVLAASYTLYIEQGTLTVNGAGGATLNAWGYTTSPGAPPMVPGPVLESREGETVTVTVHNRRSVAHNFVVRGLTTDTESIPAGGVKTYSFKTANAGTYLYWDTLNNNVNRAMGLYGAVVVRAADGSQRAWTGGPSFNLERTWVVSDMDKLRWNDVAGRGGTVNTSVYRPNYFLMNGHGGFDGMHDPKSVASGRTGDTALIRILNAGQFDQSLHFHGFHFRIIDADGKRPSSPEWGDTINVKAGTTAIVLYQLARGIYPMHIHTAQMETANGVYLNGVATLLVGN